MEKFTYGRYKYVVKETETKEVFDNNITTIRTVNIGIKDLINDIVFPHPITDFIRVKYEYSGKSVNSQIAPARVICRFLNYILERVSNEDLNFITLKEGGLKELKYIHGSKYITFLTKSGKTRNTVQYSENYLKVFYQYLFEKEIISPEFEMRTFLDNNKNLVIQSPFRHSAFSTRFPSNKMKSHNLMSKLKDFGDNRYSLVNEFILKAKEIAPEIAFGIALQFYGGIRRGEAVNLIKDNLKAKYRESLYVEIRDNRNILFGHLKDTTKENPKRLNYLKVNMAQQTILDNDLLWDLYDFHMKQWYKYQEKAQTQALFINNDGNAISGSSWDKKFNKIKKVFLKELKSTPGRFDDWQLLSNNYWSSHIGRGNFTNFLLDMGLSITQVAIARGDTSTDTVIKYVDEKVTSKALIDALNELKNTPKEMFGVVDRDLIKTHWKDGVLKREKKWK